MISSREQFLRDDKWQREMRDRILKPQFYDRNWSGRYEFLKHDDPRAKGGVDTLIMKSIRIDEKIVRWPIDKETKRPALRGYDAYAFETMSCTLPGLEKLGWIVTNIVEWLLYCFASADERSLLCHLINFKQLQDWFFREVDTATWPTWKSEQDNRTWCRIVKIEEVRRSVEVKTSTYRERLDELV